MPVSGSILDGVLYLFEPDSFEREELILGDKGFHDFVIEVHDHNHLLPDGWMLFGNDKMALFEALTHWDENNWRMSRTSPDTWALCNWPTGYSSPMTRKRFLEEGFDAWLENAEEQGWYFAPVHQVARSVLESRIYRRQSAVETAGRLGLPSPAGMPPRALDEWVAANSLEYQASTIFALLGIRNCGRRLSRTDPPEHEQAPQEHSMQDQDPSRIPVSHTPLLDPPMPAPGSVVDGVLCLFEQARHERDSLILAHASDYAFVAEVTDDSDILQHGWLLFSDDRKAIARVLLRWDSPDWSVVFVRDGEDVVTGVWEIEGPLPDGFAYELLSEDGEPGALTDPSMDPSTVKDAFLEGFIDDRISFLSIPTISSTKNAVDAIHESQRLRCDLARQMSALIGDTVPSGLSAKELSGWIGKHTPDYRACRIAELLGIRRPSGASRSALNEWIATWEVLYQKLTCGCGVQSREMARLRAAWLLDAGNPA
ncbi:MAG: hypothetical protein A2514_10110 [Gammaproteobacteria bacterium RIFOXYD12_FULL_61_37]|nr:MAG: hypothetical protein A2514_10110 [Gammaproteobacteria bacterium RIFOXYD12_FULL_61_37]